MENETESILQRFYNTLKDSLAREGIKGSLFDTLILKKNSSKIQSIFRNATISGWTISSDILNLLKNENYILPTDAVDQWIISAKGIWEIEVKQEIMSINKLMDYYNTKVFRFKNIEKDLIPREKVIIFSLLAIRAFSPEFVVNLNKSETAFEAWKKIVELSIQMILKLGELPENYSISEFYNVEDGKRKRRGNTANLILEDPMMYVFRRIYGLPEKTKNLVKNPGNRQYYLDLIQNGELYQEGLKFLIKRVFHDENLSFVNLEAILSFFDEVSFRFGPIMFESGANPYLTPSFSDKIKDSLLFRLF